MRSKIIERILSKITPEQHAMYERQIAEEMAYLEDLHKQGKIFGTDTSITLETVREAGFKPVGICWYGGEETLIFKTQKEAKSAYKKLEKEERKLCAWWYSKKDFLKEIEEDEDWYKPSKIYWL